MAGLSTCTRIKWYKVISISYIDTVLVLVEVVKRVKRVSSVKNTTFRKVDRSTVPVLGIDTCTRVGTIITKVVIYVCVFTFIPVHYHIHVMYVCMMYCTHSYTVNHTHVSKDKDITDYRLPY